MTVFLVVANFKCSSAANERVPQTGEKKEAEKEAEKVDVAMTTSLT
jgi:hypothetical protein